MNTFIRIQPTLDYGFPCISFLFPSKSDNKPDPSFLNNCNYPGAYKALSYLYGSVSIPATLHGTYQGVLTPFNQYDYLPPMSRGNERISNGTLSNDGREGRSFFGLLNQRTPTSSFDPNGFLYVPQNCQTDAKICRLHVIFHGCQMGA